MSITFAIQTWNRAEKLELCVRTIVSRMEKEGIAATIFISDNASDDNTPEILVKLAAEFDFLSYVIKDEHGDSASNTIHLFRHVKGEYIWTFGDDDLLHEGALTQVNQLLNQHQPSFCHVGHAWVGPHSGRVLKATLLEIVCQLGFNQSVGFITANIVAYPIIAKINELRLVELYLKSAFGHLGYYLHPAAHEQALYIDIPAVSPMEAQTEVDTNRWKEEKVGQRYFYIIDNLKHLMKENLIPKKLPVRFFRYLDYNLWDRYMLNMLSEELATGQEYVPNGWQYIRDVADMLEDEEVAKRIHASVDAALSMLSMRQQAINLVETASGQLTALSNTLSKPVYPKHFLL